MHHEDDPPAPRARPELHRGNDAATDGTLPGDHADDVRLAEAVADADAATDGPAGVAATTSSGSDSSGGTRGSVRTILRGGAWNAFGQVVPILVNIGLTPYVLQGFGTERFGVYLVLVAITSFLGNFDGGIGASAGRYFAVYAGAGDAIKATRLLTTLSGVVVLLGAVIVGILFAISPLVLRVFDVPPALRGEGLFLFRVLGGIVGISLLRNLFVAQLRAHQIYALPSITNTISYFAYAIGLFLSVRYETGLRGMALTFVAQTAISTVVLVPASLRYLDRRGIGLLPWGEVKEFFRFSLRVQSVGLSNLVSAQIDTYVVGGFLGLREVTLYNQGGTFAFQLRSLPMNAIAPIQTVLSRAYGAGGDEQALREFVPLQRLWVKGVAGFSAAGVAAAWFGITSWLGPDFAASGVIAIILLSSDAVNLWTANLTVLLQSTYRAGLELKYAFVTTMANIVLTVPFVLAFGLYGTVAASALAQIGASFYLLHLVRTRWTAEVPSFFREVPVLASLVTAAVTVGLELLARPVIPRGAVGLLLCGALAVPGLLVYVAMTFGLRETWAQVGPRLRARLGRG